MTPTTYILPDLSWAVLLAPIMRDARPGDVIEVHTDAMREHVEQVVREVGRTDLIVRQVEPEVCEKTIHCSKQRYAAAR